MAQPAPDGLPPARPTGLMVSEVVCGGDPITSRNYQHLERAIERGLNYLDMAPAYNGGDTELAYGKLLTGSPTRREDSLPDHQGQRLQPRPHPAVPGDLRRPARIAAGGDPPQGPRDQATCRRLETPGYYLTYFPGQQGAFESAYLRAAMRSEYGERVEDSPELRRVDRGVGPREASSGSGPTISTS